MIQQGPEVFIAADALVRIGQEDVERLKAAARANSSGKARLCAHRSSLDPVHEMLIVHCSRTYVRPHRHQGRTESFSVLEGFCEVGLFDEAGELVDLIPMGGPGSGRTFFLRLEDGRWHSLLIHSDVLVFQETTQGPFQREDTLFPPWAPAPADADAAAAFMVRFAQAASAHRAKEHL